jgi:GntR family transcriptional regulator
MATSYVGRLTAAAVIPARLAGQQRVERGELEHGQNLPAERDLAGEWGIGHQAVRRAMRELRSRGLIVSHAGEGTFAA